MKKGYFAVPKHIFTIADRRTLCDRDIGILVRALYEYFEVGEDLETITDGMSRELETITTCLVAAEEEDYESL